MQDNRVTIQQFNLPQLWDYCRFVRPQYPCATSHTSSHWHPQYCARIHCPNCRVAKFSIRNACHVEFLLRFASSAMWDRPGKPKCIVYSSLQRQLVGFVRRFWPAVEGIEVSKSIRMHMKKRKQLTIIKSRPSVSCVRITPSVDTLTMPVLSLSSL